MVVGAGVSLFMRVWGMGCMEKIWEIEVEEALVLVWVESRGVCRIREIGGEGKERKRVVVWRNHRILVWNSAGGCDKIKKGENSFKSAKAQKSVCKNIGN